MSQKLCVQPNSFQGRLHCWQCSTVPDKSYLHLFNISQCIIYSNYGTVKNSVWHNWLYTEWSEYPFITDSSLSSLIVWVRYTTCSSDDCYWHQLKTSSEWLWRCLTRWQQQCSVLFGKFYTHSDGHTLDKLRVTYLRWQNHWIEI